MKATYAGVVQLRAVDGVDRPARLVMVIAISDFERDDLAGTAGMS